MSIDISLAPPLPRNRQRLDGTPITATCEVPTKPCCGGVLLLGEECDCGPSDAVDRARVEWDLREQAVV